jgi:hypothetical protein
MFIHNDQLLRMQCCRTLSHGSWQMVLLDDKLITRSVHFFIYDVIKNIYSTSVLDLSISYAKLLSARADTLYPWVPCCLGVNTIRLWARVTPVHVPIPFVYLPVGLLPGDVFLPHFITVVDLASVILLASIFIDNALSHVAVGLVLAVLGL